MASSNTFASALAESPAYKSHFFASSSPDLPSVNTLFKRALEPPPFKISPTKASRTAEGQTAIASQSLSTAIQSRAGVQLPHEDENTSIEVEDVSLMEIEAETFLKAKSSRQTATTSRQFQAPTKDQQPWRKFKPKDDINFQAQAERPQNDGEEASLARPDTHGEPFQVSRRPKTQGPDEPLNLEPAMTRRLDWTPPAKNNPITIDSSCLASGQRGCLEQPSTRAQEFEQLLQSYKCSERRRPDMPQVEDEDCGTLKKRKLVDLVATAPNGPAQAVQEIAEKPKAAKKKPRTITEIATAAYRPDIVMQLASKGELPQTSENDGEGSKKGKRAPEKRRKRTAKKKASPPPDPVLLPPDEALREVANQDFVFGTSSQLAIEKSPTFLRYLQAVMKESNDTELKDLEGWRSSYTMDAPRLQRRLWNAGARDEDGELFDLELSNMANGPLQGVSASQEKDDPFGYLKDAHKSPAVNIVQGDSGTAERDDSLIDELPDLGSNDLGGPIERPETPTSIDVAASRREEAAATEGLDSSRPQRPSYDAYTDARLAREVKSYGFKPIKSRKASIALLEKCWQSKVRAGHPCAGVGNSAGFASKACLSSGIKEPVTPEAKRRRGRPKKDGAGVPEPDPHEPPPSAQPRESPARPRGRPRKTAAASANPSAAVRAKRGRPPKKAVRAPIEIPDSASEGESEGEGGKIRRRRAKSPRRGSPAKSTSASRSPPLGVDFSSSAEDGGLCPGSQLGSTFSFVTQAVKSAPRTRDPENPSWHEKMLLYDPIILEDLTAWLNGGELSRVGCDEEVSVAEVKQWCESRSICCLKRENLRGKERKRY